MTGEGVAVPLRDHFRPPIFPRFAWGGLHAIWPGFMVVELDRVLPSEYIAEPRVQLGREYEIDIGTLREPNGNRSDDSRGNGLAVMTEPRTTLTADVDFRDQYEYEVQIFNIERARELVAAIEIASPGNQDSPDSREKFVEKCTALVRSGVSVSMIDLVSNMHFNLYAEMLDQFNLADPAFGEEPPHTYAATCRRRTLPRKSQIDSWAYPLAMGSPLPKIPVWLSENLKVELDLEASYETACRILRIT